MDLKKVKYVNYKAALVVDYGIKINQKSIGSIFWK